MSEAQLEILKLVAQGKITPEEGDRLLAALAGHPSGEQTEGGTGTPEAGTESPRGGRFAEGIASVLEDVSETVRRTVEDAMGAAQKVFEEHRAGTESVDIRDRAFTIPAGGRLKVQQAIRVSFGGGSRGGNVVLRAAQGNQVRVIRGEAVEAHRNGPDHVLTWAKGNLELEIPRDLAGLDVRCMGGDLEVGDYPGPMSLETMGGELRVQSPRTAFRFRTLGGKVRVADLSLCEGAASVSTTGGDVQMDIASGASLTVRASTLGGSIDFPAGTERETQGKARRRAMCVIGDGAAELKVDTLGGDVRIRFAR